jgi:hypothetical protein
LLLELTRTLAPVTATQFAFDLLKDPTVRSEVEIVAILQCWLRPSRFARNVVVIIDDSQSALEVVLSDRKFLKFAAEPPMNEIEVDTNFGSVLT